MAAADCPIFLLVNLPHKAALGPRPLHPVYASDASFSYVFVGFACCFGVLCVAPAFYLPIALILGWSVWLLLAALLTLVGALINTKGRPDVPIVIGVAAIGTGVIFLAAAPCFASC